MRIGSPCSAVIHDTDTSVVRREVARERRPFLAEESSGSSTPNRENLCPHKKYDITVRGNVLTIYRDFYLFSIRNLPASRSSQRGCAG
jgi:hypothetical protein